MIWNSLKSLQISFSSTWNNSWNLSHFSTLISDNSVKTLIPVLKAGADTIKSTPLSHLSKESGAGCTWHWTQLAAPPAGWGVHHSCCPSSLWPGDFRRPPSCLEAHAPKHPSPLTYGDKEIGHEFLSKQSKHTSKSEITWLMTSCSDTLTNIDK